MLDSIAVLHYHFQCFDARTQSQAAMTTRDENILLTYAEVAEVERTSVNAIRIRVHKGHLPAERNGGHPRIPLRALSETAQKRAIEIVRSKEHTPAG